jgi:hypothetical protein
VIEEGKDALEKDEEGASFDSGLIGAALQTSITLKTLTSGCVPDCSPSKWLMPARIE